MRRGALFLVLLSQTIRGAVVSDGALLLFVVFTTLCIASLTRLDARRRTRIALPNFQGAVPAFFAKTRHKLARMDFFANRQVAFFQKTCVFSDKNVYLGIKKWDHGYF